MALSVICEPEYLVLNFVSTARYEELLHFVTLLLSSPGSRKLCRSTQASYKVDRAGGERRTQAERGISHCLVQKGDHLGRFQNANVEEHRGKIDDLF